VRILIKNTLLLLSAFAFISCTVDESGLDIESSIDVNECEASGSSNCVTLPGSNGLELNILSANPQRPFSPQGDCVANEGNPAPDPFDNPTVTPNRSYCFDISGTCNEGSNASASVIIVNPPAFIRTPLTGSLISPVIADCVRGRFRAQIEADFTTEPDTVLCQRHTIELELVGKTINDEEERNPAQARKFMDISAQNHYDCNNP
jgi:hypothetical protein